MSINNTFLTNFKNLRRHEGLTTYLHHDLSYTKLLQLESETLDIIWLK